MEAPSQILKMIKPVTLADNQYYEQQFVKKQIVLHHTCSGTGVQGDISHWNNTPERVATCMIIGRDGTPYQTFASKFWAHHLGTHEKNNTYLNQHSIGIEIDAWGVLIKVGDKYFSWTGAEVPESEVTYYQTPFKTVPNCPFFAKHEQVNRGACYYHSYSKAQIETVKELLLLWNQRYGIPLDYKATMWAVSKQALAGDAGIWTHVSFRGDKSDCHPQIQLINMLKSLTV